MTKSIQSLQRGLTVLEVLNRHPGLNANRTAKETGLTRGTAFRLLETLRNLDYLRRDNATGRYWLQRRVRALADGFSEDAWIETIARPHVERLGQTLVWPVTLTTPSDGSMLVRLNTDFRSPLSRNRFPVGHRVALTTSAWGIVYLAHCDARHRDLLIALAEPPRPRARAHAPRSNTALRLHLAQARRDGFAVTSGDRRASAVPIFSRGQPFACLTVRFFASAVSTRQLRGTLVPALKSAAAAIGQAFDAAQATP
jgi:IclR family mhp operon transcriptional activator